MLIDLYERPYSPEASKSRAFIDSILALSGPDGGVVGGEDGVSTQRPLKDGGREAWDMIRRLRQKAWQKAGLDPQMLWTEQDQIQAGVASPAAPSGSEDSVSSSTTHAGSSSSALSGRSLAQSSQPSDFNKTFYNITRSHTFSNSVPPAAIRSPLRYQYQPQDKPLPAPLKSEPHPTSGIDATSPCIDSSPQNMASFLGASPLTDQSASTVRLPHVQQLQPDVTAPGGTSFMDPMSPNILPMGVPTPPSMVDPNLNFDWDQWDAVFGQHLPVADDLMALDPVAGLDYTRVVGSSVNNGNGPVDMPTSYENGLPRSTSEDDFPSWNGNKAEDWSGYP
jgi:hypothetical protein